MNAAQKAIIHEIRQLHRRREPLNISAVKRNHPELLERVYQVRPFWGWRRALKDAGLDYSKINTDMRDHVNCKICGRDFGGIGYHLISKHETLPVEYREDDPQAELVCDTVRASIGNRRRRRRLAVPHWEEIWTPEYALDRIAELHRRGLPLNAHSAYDQALRVQARKFFGSWDEALRRVGLDPAKIRRAEPSRHLTAEQTVALLKKRRDAGLPVNAAAIQKRDGPLARAIRKYFRYHDRGLQAAGIDPVGIVKIWRERPADAADERYRTRKEVVTAVRNRLLEGRSVRDICKRDAILGAAVRKYFGTIVEAGRYFKLHPPRRSKWFGANKPAIIAEIRRRKAAGESLSCKRILRTPSGSAFVSRAKRLFGRWSDAVLAAGCEPFEGAHSPWPQAEASEIVAEIRRRRRAGKTLLAKRVDEEKWGQAFTRRTDELFGSWSAALRAAGFKPNKHTRTEWADAGPETILAELRRRAAAGESLQLLGVRKAKSGRGLLNRCDVLFGSWNAALRAADIAPARENSPWPKADKAAVVAEIRRRRIAGESLSTKKVERTKWGRPLVNRARQLFRSWPAAVAAAKRGSR